MASGRLRETWRLFEVGGRLDEDSLEEYLGRILEQCVAWFTANGASIFLRSHDSEHYTLAAQAGSDSNIPAGATILAGSGIAGLSIESGQPLLVSDPLRHPLLQGRINTHQVSLASAIVVPLIAPNEGCIGVLNLSRGASSKHFTENDLARVASLAEQLSLAVSNARLFTRMNEARRQEAAARAKLDAVVQSLGVAVMVFDHEGYVTEVNRKAAELMGANRDDWHKAFAELSVDLSLTVTEVLAKSRRSDYVRARAHDSNQDRTWSIVCTPLADGGATLVIEEVTAHERSTREMARLSRLAEIGQMTAAIAHEIRNPLTGIRSAAQMIAQSPELGIEFAGIIEEEVVKLNDICEEFLEFSRPLALRPRQLRLSELAKNLAERNRKEFDAKRVDLRVEIEPDEPTIEGDVLRLEQVMRNLVLNALQACEAGGEVRIRVRHGGFSVEDTGKGMQETDLQKLFTPFFTTKPSGTGLGLCNVRKIIDAHGGNIAVSSQPGHGSRFDISLAEKCA